MNNIHPAADELEARKARIHHPRGQFDKASRWLPDDSEWRDCCASIRSPSRAHPFSLMVHCRSAAHVANLFEVDPTELRREIKRREKEESGQ